MKSLSRLLFQSVVIRSGERFRFDIHKACSQYGSRLGKSRSFPGQRTKMCALTKWKCGAEFLTLTLPVFQYIFLDNVLVLFNFIRICMTNDLNCRFLFFFITCFTITGRYLLVFQKTLSAKFCFSLRNWRKEWMNERCTYHIAHITTFYFVVRTNPVWVKLKFPISLIEELSKQVRSS